MTAESTGCPETKYYFYFAADGFKYSRITEAASWELRDDAGRPREWHPLCL